MLFSVVIPAFNRLKYLPATLESLRRQTCIDYEIVIVDDGSTDGTREYVQSLGAAVRGIYLEHSGPGAARNAGFAAARGRYVALLDSDDLWFPWTLATFAAIIEQSSPSILTAKFVDFVDESELSPIQIEPFAARTFTDFLASADCDISAGSNTIVVERSLLSRVAGFTQLPINAEDHDFMLRLGEAPGFAQVLGPVTLGWRRHPQSLTGDLKRTIAGMWHLIGQERLGAYPGGAPRRFERIRIIARHLRPVTIACLRERKFEDGLKLYATSLWWNLRLGHWRYSVGYPPLMAMAALGLMRR